MTVFSRDLMTVAPAEILTAETVLTVVDGVVAFERGKRAQFSLPGRP